MTASEPDASGGESTAGRTRIDRVREIEPGGLRRAAATVLGAGLLLGGLRRRSLLGAASAAAGGALLYGGVSGRNPLGFAFGRDSAGQLRGTTVERTVTVGRPPEELSEYWRDADRLSRILGEFAEVTHEEGNRYRWAVTGPRGRTLSWRTRIMLDRPGEVLRWRSIDDEIVPSEWTVRFRPAPADRGTEVTLAVTLDPPGGPVGRAVAERLVPETLVWEVLTRFKSLAESGEIPTPESSPSGGDEGDLL